MAYKDKYNIVRFYNERWDPNHRLWSHQVEIVDWAIGKEEAIRLANYHAVVGPYHDLHVVKATENLDNYYCDVVYDTYDLFIS